jgi:hypothetical protein
MSTMPGGRMPLGRPRALAAALATAALAALAGCTSDPAGTAAGGATTPSTATTAGPATPTTAAATSTTAASYEARVLAWGRRFAQCARTHGYPNFPDPRFFSGDDPGLGSAEFPGVDKRVLAQAQEACLAIVRELPPVQPTRPPSADMLRQMRRFSQCMRQHGVSAFPDPKANGTFPILGTPMRVFAPGYIQSMPPAYQAAWDACFSLQTNWRMLAS